VNQLKFVLDSSAFIGGFLPEEDEYFTVYDVIKELEDEQSKERLSYFLNSGKIKIKEPKTEIVEEVTKKSKVSGDNLSLTDIKLIALAIDLDSTILSEDYGIQNVSSIMNVKSRSIRESGIQKVINWEYYCMGCRRVYPKEKEICQDCGSIIKRRPKRNKH
jgi:UPF0271 protein